LNGFLFTSHVLTEFPLVLK